MLTWVSGNYVQLTGATLTLIKITRTATTAFLGVSGQASIAGICSFQPFVIVAGETVTLPIITARNGLTGTLISLACPQLTYHEGKFDPANVALSSFQYDSNSAYVTYPIVAY